MNAMRAGSMLKTDIALALQSLGRDHRKPLRSKTLAELRAMLADLRKEQVAAGIIKAAA